MSDERIAALRAEWEESLNKALAAGIRLRGQRTECRMCNAIFGTGKGTKVCNRCDATVLTGPPPRGGESE